MGSGPSILYCFPGILSWLVETGTSWPVECEFVGKCQRVTTYPSRIVLCQSS
jgi:hypothetical protein